MGSFKWQLFAILFFNFCCKNTFAVDYFPTGYFDSSDVTKVTWAHGVNSKKNLEDSIKDSSIKMLEADLVMGTLKGSNDTTRIVIMAHPPENVSDLSFVMFLDKVIDYNKNLSLNERKGIKLDFKELEAASVALPMIKEKREQDPEQVHFPIWINADILRGPVNASENKVDGGELIDLQKNNSPNSTLSIGWTTRFGVQSDNGEVLWNGSYTQENMEEMAGLIKTKFPETENRAVEITFPLRAGLAIGNVTTVKFLLDESEIGFASPSITLWEGSDDPLIERAVLDNFLKEINSSRVFVDLPYSLAEKSAGKATSSESKMLVLTLLILFFAFSSKLVS